MLCELFTSLRHVPNFDMLKDDVHITRHCCLSFTMFIQGVSMAQPRPVHIVPHIIDVVQKEAFCLIKIYFTLCRHLLLI